MSTNEKQVPISNGDRHTKLEDLEVKQNQIIDLITEFKDNYGEEPESGLLLPNLRNASDQILKLRLKYASGELKLDSVEVK